MEEVEVKVKVKVRVVSKIHRELGCMHRSTVK
jgi:hypothetical protein